MSHVTSGALRIGLIVKNMTKTMDSFTKNGLHDNQITKLHSKIYLHLKRTNNISNIETKALFYSLIKLDLEAKLCKISVKVSRVEGLKSATVFVHFDD